MDFKKVAFVFPGQGSQAVGMGKDIAEAYPVARDTFAEADDLLGYAISEIMWNGPDEKLASTDITQPAMYINSMATLRVIREALPDQHPAYYAGHSLGEFTALTAADALTFDDGLRLVRERGKLMAAAGEQQPGGMAAILGMQTDEVEAVLAAVATETDQPLVIANDNCPGQVVISGDQAAVALGVEKAKAAGAKRAIPLNVSVATHSPLMQPASERFRELLQNTTFHEPTVPVIANVDATPLQTVNAIRAELDAQLTSTVRWQQSIAVMIEAGIDTFVEIGSNNVLTGLLRRIDRSKTGVALRDLAAVRAFLLAND